MDDGTAPHFLFTSSTRTFSDDELRAGILPPSKSLGAKKNAKRVTADTALVGLSVFEAPENRFDPKTWREQHAVVILPVSVAPDGRLTPSGKPWVPRKYLEPTMADSEFLVGHLKDVAVVQEELDSDLLGTWDGALRYCDALLRKLSARYGREPRGLPRGPARINLGVTRTAFSSALMTLCADLLRRNGSPGPRTALDSVFKGSRETDGVPEPAVLSATLPGEHPPTRDQQCVIEAVRLLLPGESVTVNGPPGTGKTAVIAATVTDAYVRTLLRDEPPCRFLLVSSNNQAVANAVSMLDVHHRLGPRWFDRELPTALGAIFPTKQNHDFDALPHVRIDKLGWHGFPPFEQSLSYVDEAERTFLATASAEIGTVGNLDAAQRELLHRCKAAEVPERLQWAVRAREVEFLRALRAAERDETAGLVTGTQQRLELLGLLFPCIGATFYRAPNLLREHSSDTSPYLFGFFRYVVVDEAGQALPEIACATLAFGERALIVGDEAQLPPIPNISRGVDVGNMESYGFDALQRKALDDGGFTASGGSLLRMSRSVTRFDDGALDRGLTLRQHFRCDDRIIAISNEMCYAGVLELQRGEIDAPLPPLAYLHAPGRDRFIEGSRDNEPQARALIAWIAGRWPSLRTAYGTDWIGDIIAIVTPFRMQKELLRRLAGETFGEEQADRMTIGTVHALQGAAARVVVFSSVCLAEDGAVGFIGERSLVNVAVSRAEDSFVFFGDAALLDVDDEGALGYVARHILASPNSELTDGIIAPTFVPVDGTRRIEGLDAHRALLTRALAIAERRLLISSPWITRNALEAEQFCTKLAERLRQNPALEIIIVADELKSQRFGGPQAIDELRAAGADVRKRARLHAKTLIVDDVLLAEGSFNWLSAQRDPDSAHADYEATLIAEGAPAAMFADAAAAALLRPEPATGTAPAA